MKTAISFLACIAMTAAARPTWKELQGYTFEQFVADFKLDFSSNEIAMRRELFRAELARVVAHNMNKDKSWKEGINKFSALSAQEKKAYHGRSKNHAKEQEKTLKHSKPLPETFVMKPLGDLPRSVDWRDADIVTAVKDQGHCGSCWAFASTATIESFVAKATGLLFDLSTEQMAMCAPNPDSCGGTGGCEGSTAELAFEYVTSSGGLQQEYSYPYTSYYGKDYDCALPNGGKAVATIDGYVQLPQNNYTALMNAVAEFGPISVSVDASSWSSYEGGIYNGCNQEQPDIDHAVVLMGYGEEDDGSKYWLIRNSWSPTWGEEGYIKLARFDFEDEICGTDITPQDGTACAGDTEPVKVCGTCGVIYDSAFPLLPSLV